MTGFIQQVQIAFETAKTDKGYGHNYQGVYGILMVDPPDSILEIGIKNGRSIKAWQMLFPHAKITGIDYKKQKLVSGIKPFTAIYHDARTHEFTERYDWIIDDGSHQANDIIMAFDRLKDKFNKFYIIEDVRHGATSDRLTRVIEHIEAAGFNMWFTYKSRLPVYKEKGIEGFALVIVNPDF